MSEAVAGALLLPEEQNHRTTMDVIYVTCEAFVTARRARKSSTNITLSPCATTNARSNKAVISVARTLFTKRQLQRPKQDRHFIRAHTPWKGPTNSFAAIGKSTRANWLTNPVPSGYLQTFNRASVECMRCHRLSEQVA